MVSHDPTLDERREELFCQEVAESDDIDLMLETLRAGRNPFRGSLIPNALASVAVGTEREQQVRSSLLEIEADETRHGQLEIAKQIRQATSVIDYFSGKTGDIDWLLQQVTILGIPDRHFPSPLGSAGPKSDTLDFDDILIVADFLLRTRHTDGPRGREVQRAREKLSYFSR